MDDASPEMLSIFAGAIERPSPGERTAFLDAACGADAELRRRIDALLRAHDEAGGFLGDRPGASDPAATVDQPTGEGPGSVIGPYKLLEPIGEGGFGLVYMAEQLAPVRRKVALKVLKPGMDTRQVVARFEAERQALALMDHPNIAKVFDGGATPSGRPYFVMELVRGLPITAFCDRDHLTLRQRLELFLPVCQAVQHAHQKGIIHRDLKPSNILVVMHDTTAVPKVIDFGVAKALGQELTDKTLFTGFAQMVGTPLYMSPEQAGQSGLDVDTRSDIYSLGVLLYELLTGTTPFDLERLRTAGYDEIRRIISEEEPPRPSTRLSTAAKLSAIATNRGLEPRRLSRLVRGELDWVVMKALEKDRRRRYETAGDLAADVRRHLDNQPVRACPPSRWYRSCKFVRRHKAAAVLASVLGTAAVVGVAILAASRSAIAREQRQTKAALQAATRAKEGLDAALRRERLDLYYERVARAEREWAINNLGRAEALLQACPADLRGWEWYYLKRLRLGACTRLQHAGEVLSVALSPDGRTLASGGAGGEIKVWDMASRSEVRTLRAHQGQVHGLAFSPDGTRLASASLDGTVVVWDADAWDEALTLRGHTGGVLGVVFSPDGRRLASAGTDKVVRVWDPTDGREVADLPGHSDAVFRLDFSPDGARLASASLDGTVMVWDLDARRELVTFRGHGRMVRGVAFSPDGRRIASADGTLWKSDDGVVRVWDAATAEPLLALHGHVGEISSLAFSPDGRRLASGGADQTLRLWDVATGREALLLRGHADLISDLAFSADGRRLASASLDQTVRVWDARPPGEEAGREVVALGARSRAVFRSVAFSPDGRRLASAGADHIVKVWEAGTWKDLFSLVGHTDDVSGVAFSPDGTRLASASGRELIIWDATTGRRTRSHSGTDRALAFSPDGARLASAADFEVRIRDAVTGEIVRALRGHESRVLGVAFSPDGRLLASASSDMTVRIWDPATGQSIRTLTGHSGRVCAVAFSPDGGRLATASLDRSVRLWDPRTGAEIRCLRDPASGALGVAFSRDGRRLAWAGMDGTVKVWDGDDDPQFLALRGHTRWVFSAAFSPDGRTVASAGADATVRVWDVTR
jgi:WD40 repeat protein/serine/threonine protein kinase